MKWQVEYALNYLHNRFQKQGSVEHVSGDTIKISIHDRTVILAAISESNRITIEIAKKYREEFPHIDFICGYRKNCLWEGEAIQYLTTNGIGWGNIGTLKDAIKNDYVNTASQRDYSFHYRLLTQTRTIKKIDREFDRLVKVSLMSGRNLRIAMLLEYEITADVIRTFWGAFGPVDIMLSVNPHARPTSKAIEAAKDLGCEVMEWSEIKALLLQK